MRRIIGSIILTLLLTPTNSVGEERIYDKSSTALYEYLLDTSDPFVPKWSYRDAYAVGGSLKFMSSNREWEYRIYLSAGVTHDDYGIEYADVFFLVKYRWGETPFKFDWGEVIK
jgi:hypothetical protein